MCVGRAVRVWSRCSADGRATTTTSHCYHHHTYHHASHKFTTPVTSTSLTVCVYVWKESQAVCAFGWWLPKQPTNLATLFCLQFTTTGKIRYREDEVILLGERRKDKEVNNIKMRKREA